MIDLYASAGGLPGVFGWISLDAFILLRYASAVVGTGADSNRYTLVLTHMI